MTALNLGCRVLPVAALAVMLAGCAGAWPGSPDSAARRPMPFHDSRLQYALVSGDGQALSQDFNMKMQPTVAERAVAGLVLPATAFAETLFWPFSTAIKTFAPLQQTDDSTQ